MLNKVLTAQGDTWDSISFALWGDESFAHALLAANPSLRQIVLFEEPALINVPARPVVKEQRLETLPPWKQGVSL